MKNIAFQINIAVADGLDLLDLYPAYKDAIATALPATAVLTRHIGYLAQPGGGQVVTIISDTVVDDALDFNARYEDFRLAIAGAFEVAEADVSIPSAEETELPGPV